MLNASAISQRNPRSSATQSTDRGARSMVCSYCKKSFTIESRFLAHECQQMKREKELKSPNGQAAHDFYQTWMRLQRRAAPSASTFLTSKYFRTFINFVEFVKRVQLPLVDRFIWLMVQKDLPPFMWTSNDVYTIFLEYLDRKMSAMDSAMLSINTVIDYCDKHEIALSQAFETMPIQEVIHLLHTRKLSPWLLLLSKTFKAAFVNRTTDEQRIVLESLIRPSYWPAKFAENKEDVAQIKALVSEMGI